LSSSNLEDCSAVQNLWSRLFEDSPGLWEELIAQ
jgi:hypothetical protein